MLALLGLITILLLLTAILKKWLSPLVALIAVPVAAGFAGGFGNELGTFIVDGVRTVAPMAAMFVFAIVFFGVMSDAGVFRPFVGGILRMVGRHPARILVGTVALGSLVHLDGSGASTFLIAIPALRPLYDELRMDRRLLACGVAMAAGVNNMLPWGGPTIRAATALDVDVMSLYLPLVPVHLAGLAAAFFIAWMLGTREHRRLGPQGEEHVGTVPPTGRVDWRFAANLLTTLAVIGAMVGGLFHPVVAFMLGVVIALCVNYPGVDSQRERIDAHARAALMMAAILFAAGAFTGIMKGSGMLDAMAGAGADLVPGPAAAHMASIVAVLSMPLSLLFDPDSFYFGVLPVLAGVAESAGAGGVQVAQGALLGQMTVGFAVSPLTPATFLLIGLAGVELADHQRFTIPYLFAITIFMTMVAVAIGVFAP